MKVIKFVKKDCAPCEAVGKWLHQRQVRYYEINAFDEPTVAAKYKVRSLPTTILVDENDFVVVRCIGFNPTDLENILRYQDR